MTMSKAQKIELRQKDAQVLDLRKAGHTFEQIAKALGWADKSTARRAYERAMRETIAEPAAEIRELEAQRLDALQQGIWARALAGNLDAISQCLRIMERRARLLGLDAPIRQHVTVITRDATEQAIAELEAQLADLQHADRGRGAAGPAAVPPGAAEQG